MTKVLKVIVHLLAAILFVLLANSFSLDEINGFQAFMFAIAVGHMIFAGLILIFKGDKDDEIT